MKISYALATVVEIILHRLRPVVLPSTTGTNGRTIDNPARLTAVVVAEPERDRIHTRNSRPRILPYAASWIEFAFSPQLTQICAVTRTSGRTSGPAGQPGTPVRFPRPPQKRPTPRRH